jgi:hypothetical protein
MNARWKTLLQFAVGSALAAAFMGFTFRNRSVSDLTADMMQADPFWIAMSALVMFAVYLFRSLRWQLLLESAGHASGGLSTLIATLVCYLVNSYTPKLGEIARCSVLYRSDRVPLSVGFGTVVSERVIDLIALLLGIGYVLLAEFGRLSGLLGQIFGNLTATLTPAVWAGLGLFLLLGLASLWWLMRFSPRLQGLPGRLAAFARQTVESARSIFALRRPWLFLLYTLLIWASLALMNYFFLLALPDTQHLSFYIGFLILFVGGLGWAVPVPGGMGTTHYIILQIFLAYGLEGAAGQNIGLLSNGATLIFTTLYGIIAWALLPLLLARTQKA